MRLGCPFAPGKTFARTCVVNTIFVCTLVLDSPMRAPGTRNRNELRHLSPKLSWIPSRLKTCVHRRATILAQKVGWQLQRRWGGALGFVRSGLISLDVARLGSRARHGRSMCLRLFHSNPLRKHVLVGRGITRHNARRSASLQGPLVWIHHGPNCILTGCDLCHGPWGHDID